MSRFGYRSLLAALLTAALLLLIQPVNAQAASSGTAYKFLQLDGIKGSYAVDPYKGASIISSYSLGSTSPVSVLKGALAPSKQVYSDIHITKPLDAAASPALLKAAAKGTVIPNGYLYLVSPGQEQSKPYMIIHFTNLVITGYSVSADQGDMMESISLHAESVLYKYTSADSTDNPSPVDPVVTSITTLYHFDPLYATTEQGYRYVEGFHVSLKAASTKSTIASTRYRINGGGWIAYEGPFDIYAATTHTVEYYSTDVNGNVESTNVMNFDDGTFTGKGKY